MNGLEFTVHPVEGPLRGLFGPWSVRCGQLVLSGATSRAEAEELAGRLQIHDEGGFVDPATGKRYMAPKKPVRDEGRPSSAEVLAAIEKHEAYLREPCAAFVGVDPESLDDPWPPCIDFDRTNSWDRAEETGHALLEVFPIRVLTDPLELLPTQRLVLNDLHGQDVLEITWEPGALEAAGWNGRLAEAEDAFDKANKLIVDTLFAARKGKAPPAPVEVRSAHLGALKAAMALTTEGLETDVASRALVLEGHRLAAELLERVLSFYPEDSE